MSEPPLLATRDLRKRYGRRLVLDGLSLAVRPGEIYGFLGRNGAGKTTTIRIIMGILRGDEGTLEIFGDTVRRATVGQKRQIGYVSQEQHFYPWMTCRRLGRFVGGFYPGWDEGEFARLMEVMDVPGDLRVSALSHGMKVKLALALALAHRPRLLVLDEPTAGLDPAARREFLEIVRLQSRRDGRTTFFSSHIVEEVERVADRIGIIDAGRIAYEGSVAELRASVRAVRLPADSTAEPVFPEAFRVLQRGGGAEGPPWVLQAPPEAWEAAPFPPECLERLTLEDVFLAIAVRRVTQP
jgi:ABC-2 type transport system ATP-binding protein